MSEPVIAEPKVGEWWWHGVAGMFMNCGRIVAIKGDEVGIVNKLGRSDCIYRSWLLGPMSEVDIPKIESDNRSWWSFW